MKNAYKVFVDYFESKKPSAGFHSLREYIDWFERQFGEITTPSNSSTTTFYFTFDAVSEETIFDDVLNELIGRLPLNFEDDKGELEEYVKVVGTATTVQRYLDSSDEGLFYSILDLKSEDSFIQVYIDLSSDFMHYHPDLEECLNQMESWDEFRSYEEDEDGYAHVDWKELGEYISDHLIQHVYDDLGKLLNEFSVTKCAGTWFEVDDSLGVSYYVLSGYNPKSKCGEAYVIEDSCH